MSTPSSTPAPSGSPAKPAAVNRLGLTMDSYKGAESTLCAGCGHNSITTQVIKACFSAGVPPHKLVKVSGIGCSSRTPAFFVRDAHGFNGVHGRMPTLATGVLMANHNLQLIGVSGDGDTASIGMSHFVHTVRRNVDMVYLVENNGVYSLTKGQLSATAEIGSRLKSGKTAELPPVDICGLAIEMGCGFVARSFSGDARQLAVLLDAALRHKGTAVLDVLSPCITFNNHEGSTMSYKCLKDRQKPLHEIDLCEEAALEYNADGTKMLKLGDGSMLKLRKLSQEYDPKDRYQAINALERARREKSLLTGLIYYNTDKRSFKEYNNAVDEPLATLPLERVRPPVQSFDDMLAPYV